MLLVDREKRDKSDAVTRQLKVMLNKCQHLPAYALYPGAKELDGNELKRTVDDLGQDSGSSAHGAREEVPKRTRRR